MRTPPDGHKFHMAAQSKPTQSEPVRDKPTLAEPTPRVHASFVEAVREYRAEGRYRRLDPARLADTDQFRRYLRQNIVLVASYWMSFEFARDPKAVQDDRTLARGAFHVIALAAPSRAARARIVRSPGEALPRLRRTP